MLITQAITVRLLTLQSKAIISVHRGRVGLLRMSGDMGNFAGRKRNFEQRYSLMPRYNLEQRYSFEQRYSIKH